MISDGCGLSKHNRLSPLAAATLLRQLALSSHAQIFLPTLAIGNVDGSLARRLSHCSGRFIGKTGTVSGVSTLAGYILDGQGKPIAAAAIFSNDPRFGLPSAHRIQDVLVSRWVVEFGQVRQ